MPTVTPTATHLKRGRFHLYYDVVNDAYEMPDYPKFKGLGTLLFENRGNCVRKVEGNHKKTYITSSGHGGELVWKFNHTGQKVKRVEVTLTGMVTFNGNQRVSASLKCGNKEQPLNLEEERFGQDETNNDAVWRAGYLTLLDVGPADFTELRVKLENGAQLFRTNYSQQTHNNLDIDFRFEGGDMREAAKPPQKQQPSKPATAEREIGRSGISVSLKFADHGISKGFLPPKGIVFVGVPLGNRRDDGQQRWDINLAAAGEPYKDANVFLHISVRYCNTCTSADQIVRNRWIVGKGWQKQEEWLNDEILFPLSEGREFSLGLMAMEGGKIICMLEDKELFTWQGREGELEQIAQMQITDVGKCVQIKSIVMQG